MELTKEQAVYLVNWLTRSSPGGPGSVLLGMIWGVEQPELTAAALRVLGAHFGNWGPGKEIAENLRKEVLAYRPPVDEVETVEFHPKPIPSWIQALEEELQEGG
jgi:hypothetical protein